MIIIMSTRSDSLLTGFSPVTSFYTALEGSKQYNKMTKQDKEMNVWVTKSMNPNGIQNEFSIYNTAW